MFCPPKTQFLFLLNFEFSLQNEAGSVSVFLWSLPETYSHIRRGQHPIVKIDQKKKLTFRGVKHNKNEKPDGAATESSSNREGIDRNSSCQEFWNLEQES